MRVDVARENRHVFINLTDDGFIDVDRFQVKRNVFSPPTYNVGKQFFLNKLFIRGAQASATLLKKILLRIFGRSLRFLKEFFRPICRLFLIMTMRKYDFVNASDSIIVVTCNGTSKEAESGTNFFGFGCKIMAG